MSLVICKCGCGQKIESSVAKRVKLNGITCIFANDEHYQKWRDNSKKNQKSLEDPKIIEIYDIIVSILHKDMGGKMLIKEELPVWEAMAPYETIKSYLIEFKSSISKAVVKKEFTSPYNAIKYIGAILVNNLPKYKAQTTILQAELKNSDYTFGNSAPKRIGLDELEDLL